MLKQAYAQGAIAAKEAPLMRPAAQGAGKALKALKGLGKLRGH